MSTYGSPLFMNLGESSSKPQWEFFAFSYAFQLLGVAALICYTIFAPRITPPVARHVELVAPDLTPAQRSVPPRQMPAQLAKHEAPKIILTAKVEAPILHVQQPQRVQHFTQPAEIAQPQIAVTPSFDSKALASIPAARPRIVATNTFGSSAPQTLQNIAPSKVQTGGFGDPNGVPANAHGNSKSIIAAAGSFDLPAGGGYGNGTGGTKGVRGTVASAGFGNGVAVQSGPGRNQSHVQSTSFVSVTVPTPMPAERHANVAAPNSVPVSIQSKPTPVYTSEARELKIEGEVLLNVVFAADGKVRVVNVVRGLGHGLDEAAQRAAQGVRFNPAMRDGHPVDSNAVLHVVFQLS